MSANDALQHSTSSSYVPYRIRSDSPSSSLDQVIASIKRTACANVLTSAFAAPATAPGPCLSLMKDDVGSDSDI
jgi:hypothetical protein